MEWTNDPPKVPGAYWFFDSQYDDVVSMRDVRDYAGRMAVDNWVIIETDRVFWMGPVDKPEPPQAKEE